MQINSQLEYEKDNQDKNCMQENLQMLQGGDDVCPPSP